MAPLRPGICAYCQRPLLQLGAKEDEHVIPRSREPTSTLTVPSCARCNRFKGDRVSGIDPLTELLVPFYNPLQMKWVDHFFRRDGQVLGKTAIGRATSAQVFRETDSFFEDPGYWPYRETIDDASLQFQTARLRRLYRRNQWAQLESGLDDLVSDAAEGYAVGSDVRQADFLMAERLHGDEESEPA